MPRCIARFLVADPRLSARGLIATPASTVLMLEKKPG